jgi:hypothetical protein
VPSGGASPADADGVVATDATAGLELERHVAVSGSVDHVFAREFEGLAGAFFIATEDDANLGVFEGAGLFHGAESGEHDDEAAFHVADAGAGGNFSIGAGDDGEFLEWALGLEDGIHVSDEENAIAALAAAAGTGVFGDKVASALGLRLHGHPADGEAEGLEARGEHVFDGYDARQVHGSTVDVDDLFKQPEVVGKVGVDGARGALFEGREVLRW